MSVAFEQRFEQPEHDGRAIGEMMCVQAECDQPAQTWCPLCEKLLCLKHDELVPARCHDCIGGPVDE